MKLLKHANTIQWVAIAAVIGVALLAWCKPRHAGSAETTDLQVRESYPSDTVLVAVAPVQFHGTGRSRGSTIREITVKAWEQIADVVSQVDGVTITKSSHPDVLITAAITDLHDERHQFDVYNIKGKSVEAHCVLRIQVLDPATGAALFSKTLTGEKSDTQTDYAKSETSESERQLEAVSAAIHKLDADDDFKRAVLHSKTSTNASQSIN